MSGMRAAIAIRNAALTRMQNCSKFWAAGVIPDTLTHARRFVKEITIPPEKAPGRTGPGAPK
jgi:hypothetical protein